MAIHQTRTQVSKQRAILKAYQQGKLKVVKTDRPHIDETLSGLLPGDIVVIAGASGCVDNKTEYFNGTEWKSIADYQEGDRVLQYNPDGSAELVVPYEYIRKEATDFYLIKSKYGVNQCVSEEHNLVYLSSKGNINKKTTLDLIKQHEGNVYGFRGKFITSFKGYRKSTMVSDRFEYYLRLVVAIQADAHYYDPNYYNEEKGGYRICFNLKKTRKKERLENLLEKLEYHYVKKDISHQKGKKGFHKYTLYFPKNVKEFPEDWYKLGDYWFQIIFDEIKYWDGCLEKGNRMFSYFTNNKKNADFIQFVCTSLGYRTSLKADTHKDNINYVVRPTVSNLCSISNKNKVPIEKYIDHDGFKYCFRVPSGMLVLRREGDINVTGNSGKTFELQTIRENIMDSQKNEEASNYVFLDYSFEMKLFNLILRGLNKVIKKSKKNILLKEFSESEKALANRYIETLMDDRFYIEENPLTPEQFLNQTREFLTQHADKKSVIIAVDHMALFKNSKGDKKVTIDEVVESVNNLKKEFKNVIFILLTQLNRSILSRIAEKDLNSQPNRGDIFQSDTMFHIADYLIVVHNPYRLGINQYLRVNPDHYSHLTRFFCAGEGVSKKVSFETVGNIFYHVLKVREGDVVFKDLYIEEVVTENLEMYRKEKIDVVEEGNDFDDLDFEGESDKF